MSAETVFELRAAVDDPAVVARYWSHVLRGTERQCWLWTGAISGKGHGRFQLSDRRAVTPAGVPTRQTFVVIAHRFGYAVQYGVDALLAVPIVAHNCDNPLCQNPTCWRESNHRANASDLYRRRDIVRGPLADVRGARDRARAVRDAARNGQPIEEAVLAGLRPVHRDQRALFGFGPVEDEHFADPRPEPSASRSQPVTAGEPRSKTARSGVPGG